MSTNSFENNKSSSRTSKDDPNSPADNTMKVIDRILDKMGPVNTKGKQDAQSRNPGPVDTKAELDAQINNRGPVDTQVESKNQPDKPEHDETATINNSLTR